MSVAHPFSLTPTDIECLLARRGANLPELEDARANIDRLWASRQAQAVLAGTAPALENLEYAAETSYSAYRAFRQTGDRQSYQHGYFLRRSRLTAAALRLFLGDRSMKSLVQDNLWAICEESNWVAPAHEGVLIDIMAAETGYQLAETLGLLGSELDGEVRARAAAEVERRICDPYLRHHAMHWWYLVDHNWNAVCNSAVAATFLWLEREPQRLAYVLSVALTGLRQYVERGFEADGTCSEGVGYWNYGLMNFVALAEMLRSRTAGDLDLLANDRMRDIAQFPGKVHLSGEQYAAFADCDERVNLSAGAVTRLAERTGMANLARLVAPPDPHGERWRLPMELRSLLWWDGQPQSVPFQEHAWLKAGGLARLTGKTSWGAPVIVAARASDNGANHSHNDAGSFIVHVAGENLLTDPGRGLYTRQYFGTERYNNVFVNSYGHGVPRIGGVLQSAGKANGGTILSVDAGGAAGGLELELAGAYRVPELASLRRRIILANEQVALEDLFAFEGAGHEVEEACVTWADVEVNGPTATVQGVSHCLQMTIVEPPGASWAVEELTEASRANAKPGLLRRLTFLIPQALRCTARVIMKVSAR